MSDRDVDLDARPVYRRLFYSERKFGLKTQEWAIALGPPFFAFLLTVGGLPIIVVVATALVSIPTTYLLLANKPDGYLETKMTSLFAARRQSHKQRSRPMPPFPWSGS